MLIVLYCAMLKDETIKFTNMQRDNIFLKTPYSFTVSVILLSLASEVSTGPLVRYGNDGARQNIPEGPEDFCLTG